MAELHRFFCKGATLDKVAAKSQGRAHQLKHHSQSSLITQASKVPQALAMQIFGFFNPSLILSNLSESIKRIGNPSSITERLPNSQSFCLQLLRSIIVT